jgi:tetratricopeptide (TPR) repeat protein
MPTLTLRPTLIRSLLPPLLVAAGAVGLGWWLGQRQPPKPPPVDPRRVALSQEAALLRTRVEASQATPQERQRLLELLVGLERKAEAMALLEGMADREPQRWSLRLMLAELRRDQGDLAGAERELRQILHQRPAQIEALQLMSLVLLERERGGEAEALVNAAYTASSKPPVKPEALGQGLLLAEVRQRRQRPAEAETTYRQLMAAFPTDQRPPLGLALLRHQRGNVGGALEALDQARQRDTANSANQAALDRLATDWKLKASRPSPPLAGGTTPASPPASRPMGVSSGPPAP